MFTMRVQEPGHMNEEEDGGGAYPARKQMIFIIIPCLIPVAIALIVL